MDKKINQLRLGNRNGLFEYRDLSYFYSMVLNSWKGDYPDGKIDYMRYLMDYSRLSGEEIYSIMRRMYAIYGAVPNQVDETIVVVDWEHIEDYKDTLSNLLFYLTNCMNMQKCFKEKSFDKAFERFIAKDPKDVERVSSKFYEYNKPSKGILSWIDYQIKHIIYILLCKIVLPKRSV